MAFSMLTVWFVEGATNLEVVGNGAKLVVSAKTAVLVSVNDH